MSKRELTNDERRGIFQHLQKKSNDGKLPHNFNTETSRKYKVPSDKSNRIWKRGTLHQPLHLDAIVMSIAVKGIVAKKPKTLQKFIQGSKGYILVT